MTKIEKWLTREKHVRLFHKIPRWLRWALFALPVFCVMLTYRILAGFWFSITEATAETVSEFKQAWTGKL